MKWMPLVGLATVALFQAAHGQSPPEIEAFRELYNANHKKLVSKYIYNKEIKATITFYNEFDDSGNKTGSKNDRHKINIISDGSHFRLHFDESTENDFVGSYSFNVKESSFDVVPGVLKKWSIKNLKYKYDNYPDYGFGGFVNIIKCPLCGQSFNFEFRAWLNSPSTGGPAAIHPELFDASEDTFHGVQAVRIDGRLKALQSDKTFVDYNCSFFFDPADFYSTIGFRTDFYKALDSKLPRKTIVTIDYYSEKGIKKYPKKYMVHDEFPSGLKVPRMEIDFTDFHDYTPFEDDFKLEKKFGLKTPTKNLGEEKSFMYNYLYWLVISAVAVLLAYWFLTRGQGKNQTFVIPARMRFRREPPFCEESSQREGETGVTFFCEARSADAFFHKPGPMTLPGVPR